MLQRVHLDQRSFVIPGLSADERGIAFGQKGLALFPTLSGLVSCLEGAVKHGASVALHEEISIARVESALGLREWILEFHKGHPRALDPWSSHVKSAAGFLFTGTTRHFVQVRDASSPFGYDADSLGGSAEERGQSADYVLHHTSFQQSFRVLKRYDLREFSLSLPLRAEPHNEGKQIRYARVPEGIASAFGRYLLRHNVSALASRMHTEGSSARGSASQGYWLFRFENLDLRIAHHLGQLPLVVFYTSDDDRVAVALGFAPSFPRDALASAFKSNELIFFEPGHKPMLLAEAPGYLQVESLFRLDLQMHEDGISTISTSKPEAFEIEMQIRPSTEALGQTSLALIPRSEWNSFLELIHRLPVNISSALSILLTSHFIVVRSSKSGKQGMAASSGMGSSGIALSGVALSGIALGVPMTEAAPSVFVPVGSAFVPQLPRSVLALHTQSEGQLNLYGLNAHLDGFPARVSVREDSFVELSKSVRMQLPEQFAAALAFHDLNSDGSLFYQRVRGDEKKALRSLDADEEKSR